MTAEGELRETGAIATGQSDYTAPEEPEEICLLLLASAREMRHALSTGAGEASILLRRLTLSGVKWEDETPTLTLTAEARGAVRRWKHDPGNAGSGPAG